MAEPQDPVDESGLTEKERDLLSIQSAAFDALERDFQEVLHEIMGDKSMTRFQQEYERLHTTLKRSHANEKKLIKKCRELNNEICVNASKINTAIKLSQQDHDSIKLLRAEIDKAWHMVDGAQEKEKRAHETITRLKGEIQNLSRLVDQGAGLSIGQENAVQELVKKKDQLTEALQHEKEEVANKKKELQMCVEQRDVLQARCDEGEKLITKLKTEQEKLKEKVVWEKNNAKTHLEKMIKIQKEKDDESQKLSGQTEACLKLDDTVSKLQQELGRMRKELEGVTIQRNQFEEKAADLEEKHSKAIEGVQQFKRKSEKLELVVKNKNVEIDNKVKECDKELRNKVKALEDQEKLRKEKRDAEKYKNWLKDEMKACLKSVEAQRKDAETDEKLIKELQHQIKRLTSSLINAKNKNAAAHNLVTDHEATKKDLQKNIKHHKSKAEKLLIENYDLEKEKERSAMKASSWHAKYLDALETIKLKEMEIVELQKNIQEEKNKLKLQQNLYEQVRSDRNLFSKQQVQSEDEIAEMKRKFKIMTHQIDQLKEEIQNKDAALINEHFAYKRLQDEKKVMKRNLAKRRELLSTADQVLASQDAEIKNLRTTLTDAERAQRQQKKVYDDVVTERDILGTQLIRRNDELALFHEKIRIQASTLAKGEIQYRERLADIRALKLEINNTRRQLAIRQHEVTNIEALKNEVYHVQRELLQERTKVKALSEELENPMNVHRYRKLEGSDPKRYELIQKIQTLQKRLILKTEQVVEKDLLLQEKEKLYAELKNLLARQPGPEVAEQLSVYQHSHKEKNRQMKAMAAELNMFQAQVNEHRYELERVTRELQDVKRKYFEQRRKDQIAKEAERADDTQSDPLAQQQQQFHATQAKITGGGFNLQPGQKEFVNNYAN